MANLGIGGFGSVNNLLMSRGTGPEPKVGMAATILSWTDRYPATVIYVSPSGKTVRVQECDAKRTDSNGMDECQSYEFTDNPNGSIRTFRLTKKGWRGPKGSGALRLGTREKYHDFSF